MPRCNKENLNRRNRLGGAPGGTGLWNRALPMVVVAVLCTSMAAALPNGVDVVGKPRKVTTAKKIAGGSASVNLATAWAGPDFHIFFRDLPANKTVELEMGFAELQNAAAGERIFDVEVNGKQALTGFDIAHEAGGPLRPVVKKFTITPKDGELDFRFVGVKGDALVSYIKVEGGKTIIASPAETSSAASTLAAATADAGPAPFDDDDHIPADAQASFNVEDGSIELDSTSETWNSGVPVGGIGTGKFEILPNGQFANFTINNSWDLPVLKPKGTFLALAAKASSGGGAARLIQINPSDAAGKSVFTGVSTMESAKFTGRFPFGKTTFKDKTIPLLVTVESWSPLIPYNLGDSSLPAGVVNVTVENPSKYPISTAVAFSWEDINGRGGSLLPGDQHGFSSPSYHKDAATSEVTGIQVATSHLETDRAATFMGDYFVGSPIKGAVITRKLGWNPRTGSISWWKQFGSRLRLDKIPNSPASSAGNDRTGPLASVVCVSFNLAPKEVRRVPFIVSWYMPHIVTLDSAGGTPREEIPDYAGRFGSSVGVASYLAKHRREFRAETDDWFDMVERATVPNWLKTHALNSLFPLHSNTILLKDQRFAMLESPADMKGMLGPVDLKMGSDEFLLTMFPDLQKTELNLFGRAQETNGRIPRYVGNIHGALAGFDKELLGDDWYDPTASWLLELGRYWHETGDRAALDALKPAILKAKQYLVTAINAPGDAAAKNVYSALGHYPAGATFSRLKALAALRAADDLLGKDDAATRQTINTALKEIELPGAASTFAPMLAGDFMLRTAGLRGLFPAAQDLAYLKRIIKNNFANSKPVPLMEADNAGKAVAGAGEGTQMDSAPAPLQTAVGSLALSLGDAEAGLMPFMRMFQVAYAAQKAPWKQALRYDAPAGARAAMRYHRSAMSAWAVWRAVGGIVYDAPQKRIYLDPHPLTTGTQDFEIPVFTSQFRGWLKYSSEDSTGTLAITDVAPNSRITLSEVASGLGADGKPENLVKLSPPLEIEEGAVIALTNWPGGPNAHAAATSAAEMRAAAETERLKLQAQDESTSASLTADDAESTDTESAPQSSPATANGEEMTTGTE